MTLHLDNPWILLDLKKDAQSLFLTAESTKWASWEDFYLELILLNPIFWNYFNHTEFNESQGFFFLFMFQFTQLLDSVNGISLLNKIPFIVLNQKIIKSILNLYCEIIKLKSTFNHREALQFPLLTIPLLLWEKF